MATKCTASDGGSWARNLCRPPIHIPRHVPGARSMAEQHRAVYRAEGLIASLPVPAMVRACLTIYKAYPACQTAGPDLRGMAVQANREAIVQALAQWASGGSVEPLKESFGDPIWLPHSPLEALASSVLDGEGEVWPVGHYFTSAVYSAAVLAAGHGASDEVLNAALDAADEEMVAMVRR